MMINKRALSTLLTLCFFSINSTKCVQQESEPTIKEKITQLLVKSNNGSLQQDVVSLSDLAAQEYIINKLESEEQEIIPLVRFSQLISTDPMTHAAKHKIMFLYQKIIQAVIKKKTLSHLEYYPGSQKQKLKNVMSKKSLFVKENLKAGVPWSLSFSDLTEIKYHQTLNRHCINLTGHSLTSLSGIETLQAAALMSSLKLSGNQIKSLAEISEKFPHLSHLSLNGNKLRNLENLEKLSHLQSLHISNNKLTEISLPDILTSCPRLCFLSIAGNPLKTLDLTGIETHPGFSDTTKKSILKVRDKMIEKEEARLAKIRIKEEKIQARKKKRSTPDSAFKNQGPAAKKARK